jgi:carbamoyl-phosphate synthase large subunit
MKRVAVLFTCVGRRIELIQAFRGAARRLGLDLRTIGVDSDVTAPALTCVDRAELVPRAADATYADAIADIVRRHEPRLLVPTIDTDLRVVAANRQRFADLGCIPLIGDPDVIAICRDKVRTYQHLCAHHIDTPETFVPADFQRDEPRRFPLFIKPRTGSASQWVHRIDDAIDLAYFLHRVEDPIVQEFVAGCEHTLDVYVGLDGTPRCVVPRMRWQVRGGEVSKGVVNKDPEIIAAGRRVVETLGPSVRGIVTLQCIVTPERRIRFIEINPRFGGGVPLSIAAGADFPAWLLQELRDGRPPAVDFEAFRHGTCMLRYDWSVFLPLGDDLKPQLVAPTRAFPPFS